MAVAVRSQTRRPGPDWRRRGRASRKHRLADALLVLGRTGTERREGDMPARDALPVSRMQQRGDAMRRDPRPYQLRYSAMAVTAGLTLLLYAAIR